MSKIFNKHEQDARASREKKVKTAVTIFLVFGLIAFLVDQVMNIKIYFAMLIGASFLYYITTKNTIN